MSNNLYIEIWHGTAQTSRASFLCINMQSRVIHTRFWTDDYINELSIKEAHLFIYLITNERVNICGAYEIPEAYIHTATKIPTSEIHKIKEKFQQDGKFMFFKSWVRIMNCEKYQQYRGEKNDIARERELALCPKELFNSDSVGIQYRYPIDTSSNQKSEISNKKLELRNVENVAELKKKFPNVDVETEIEKMLDWLSASGKAKKDYIAFARNWLRKVPANNSPKNIV